MRDRHGLGVVTVRRLYATELPDRGGPHSLIEASAAHARVLRLGVGDSVILFDGNGREATATITSIDRAGFVCDVEPPTSPDRMETRIVLLLSIPKGPKLDRCLRMATELGADEVALAYSERTVPRWDPGRSRAKIDRLVRIASEAAAQCERNDLPVIQPPMPLEAWLERRPTAATGLVFGARTDAPVPALPATTEQVWCAIGPEGGFSDRELTGFVAAGFAPASLGRQILRVETAVPAALTLVQDRLGDLRQPR